MQRLQSLRRRFEVAADTLHPHWRELLPIIGEPSERVYDGHPHDWVVSEQNEPIPLRQTYLQWDLNFTFKHLEESVIDEDAWGPLWDPRRPTPAATDVATSGAYICDVCGERQEDDPKENYCRCFPALYGCIRQACPVQVFRTANGRNNGLEACLVSQIQCSQVILNPNLFLALCRWKILYSPSKARRAPRKASKARSSRR